MIKYFSSDAASGKTSELPYSYKAQNAVLIVLKREVFFFFFNIKKQVNKMEQGMNSFMLLFA